MEKLKLKLLYLPNGEHDEVYVGEVVSQPEVAPLPLGDGGLVEVGEGQLVPQVPDQLGPGNEGGVFKVCLILQRSVSLARLRSVVQ